MFIQESDAHMKHCPVQSRVVIYPPHNGSVPWSSLHEVKCKGRECAFWRDSHSKSGMDYGFCGAAAIPPHRDFMRE